VEVLRNGAAHVDDCNAVVVVGVEQMGGELLPPGALVSLRDHPLITPSCRIILISKIPVVKGEFIPVVVFDYIKFNGTMPNTPMPA
jgi:hypothetical protein